MKNRFKRLLCGMLTMALLVPGSTVFAESTDSTSTTTESEPYLALGADLTADQKSTVLELLGVDESQLDSYNVVYITNDEEHEYLDSYMDSDSIGTKSLSSVVVYQGEEGSGLNITTKNISYCTEGMYENACATAGITDATIVIAGPTSISGTAALVGIFKAYEQMTGEEISEDVIEGALEELIITGDLESTISSIDNETLEELIAYAKSYMAEHDLSDEESISAAVDEACEKYGVTLTDSEKEQVVSLLMKLSTLDLDQIETLLNGAQTVSNVATTVSNFFTSVGKAISDFFTGLFGN